MPTPTVPVTSETENAGPEFEHVDSETEAEWVASSLVEICTISTESVHMDELEIFHMEQAVKASVKE